jgi:hypothetical protein
VLSSQLLQRTKGRVIDYTFTVGFDHSVRNEEIITQCIQPSIEAFYKAHQDELPDKPKYYLEACDRLGRTFAIRVFFRKGQAKALYSLQPELLSMIVSRWDDYRKTQTSL